MTHTIFIRGMENWPDVNIRNQPGLAESTILFRVPKGWRATCSEVQADPQGAHFEEQVYQWFLLTFDDGRQGWARDDLLDMIGDCTTFGYAFYSVHTFAFVASGQIAEAGDSFDPETRPVFTENEVCSARVRRDIAARVRAQPAIKSARMGLLNPGTAISVLGVVSGQDNDSYRWIKARSGDVHGYIREDLLVYTADCATLGLESDPDPTPPTDDDGSDPNQEHRFEAPLKGSYSVTQEYAQPGGHRGVDLAGNQGISVYAGGKGHIAYTVSCTKCSASAPNFKSHGLKPWDDEAIADRSWGYGFGHYIVVRYAWHDLPEATRDRLTVIGLEGAYAYVIYAHLKQIKVSAGALVNKGTPLGTLGNTGNSSGPHLHLGVKASMVGNETTLFNRRLIDPRDMFAL